MPSIAYHLRELREEHRLSQSEFASAMGVNRMTINNYETGKRVPDIDFAVRAAKFFDVTLEFICGRSEYRHREDIEVSVKKAERLALAIGQMPQSEGQQLLVDLSSLLEDTHDNEIDRPILLGMINVVSGYRSMLKKYVEMRDSLTSSTMELRLQGLRLDMLHTHQREKIKGLSDAALISAKNICAEMEWVNDLMQGELKKIVDKMILDIS